MQPVQSKTVLIINPSDSAESANLAFGVRQEPGLQPGSRPATPRAEGAAERQAGEPGADPQPAPHAAARATMQAQLPPVRSQRMVANDPRPRMTAAVSMIATGSLSVGVSVGMLAHTIVSTAIESVHHHDNPSSDPAHPEINPYVGRIATAAAAGMVGGGMIFAGVSLLRGRSDPAPTIVDGQIQLPRRARQREHFPVPLQEIVIEPNAVDLPGPAAASTPTVAQAGDKPDSPRWDAAAASAQLPFAEDHG